MEISAKRVSIGTAISGLIVSVIYGIGQLITPTWLLWGLIGLGLGILALQVSWVWTQFYKSFFVPPSALDKGDKTPDQIWAVTRIIYIHAVGSGLMVMIAEGLVIFTIHTDRLHELIWVVVWGVWSIIIAGASPFLWKVVFEMLLPWIARKYQGLGVRIDRDPKTGEITGYKDETDPEAVTKVFGRKPPESKQ